MAKKVSREVNIVELDIREDEVTQDGESISLVGAKSMVLRSIRDNEFKVIQLEENPSYSV